MLDGDGLQQQSTDVNFSGASFRVFKDAWDMPIAFVRQAYPDEINGSPYVRNLQNRDPFDPANKLTGSGLMTARWTPYMFNYPTWAVPTPASAPTLINLKTIYPGVRNFVPTLISAGPNKVWEADLFGGADNDNLLSYRLRREGNRGD